MCRPELDPAKIKMFPGAKVVTSLAEYCRTFTQSYAIVIDSISSRWRAFGRADCWIREGPVLLRFNEALYLSAGRLLKRKQGSALN